MMEEKTTSIAHGLKPNPQIHLSAVAAMVALADAEEKGEVTDFKSIPPPPPIFLRRNPSNKTGQMLEQQTTSIPHGTKLNSRAHLSAEAKVVALSDEEENEKTTDFRTIPPTPQTSDQMLEEQTASTLNGLNENPQGHPPAAAAAVAHHPGLAVPYHPDYGDGR